MSLSSEFHNGNAIEVAIDDVIIRKYFATTPEEAKGRTFIGKEGDDLYVRQSSLTRVSGLDRQVRVDACEYLKSDSLEYRIAYYELMAHGLVPADYYRIENEEQAA